MAEEVITTSLSASQSVFYRKVGGLGWADRDPHGKEEKREQNNRGNLVMVLAICRQLHGNIAIVNPP
jgi:hypothetical protein